MGLKGIIFDPQRDSRTRLKMAINSMEEFEIMTPCSSRRETMQWFDTHDRVDLLFLAEDLGAKMVQGMAEEIRATAKGDATVLVVVKPEVGGILSVEEALLAGAHGILCEPFSIEKLTEVVRLARRVQKERGDLKQRLAITLLVTDMIHHIDTAAYLMSQECQPRTSMKALQTFGKELRALPPEALEDYFTIALRLFVQAKPAKGSEIRTKLYRGVSDHVRRNTEIKLWKEISTRQKLEEDEE